MKDKLLSARFLMAILFSFTTCIGFAYGSLDADVFIPLASLVIGFYFNRQDRKKGE